VHLADDQGQVLNAQYSIESDGDLLALILESAGGRRRSGGARNADYRQALMILLTRLRERDAVLQEALLDSRATAALSEDERTLFGQPVRLAEHHGLEDLRLQLTSAQGRIGQTPGAPKAGSNSKRIRLRLRVPGYGLHDANRLATDLAVAAVTNRPYAEPSTPTDALEPLAGGRTRTTGSGYIADTALKLALERHAMRRATEFYEKHDYDVADVSSAESFDLRAVRTRMSCTSRSRALLVVRMRWN
jgi:hypothetical protein